MRILVLCYEFPPVGGGGGRVAFDVAKGLRLRGHEIRVLTSHTAELSREETIDGISVRRAFAGRRRADRCTIPEMAVYIAAHVGLAVREAARFRPDVIHCHFAVPTGIVALAASRWNRTPYLLTVHLGDVPGGVPEQTDLAFKFIKPLTIPIWRCASKVTAVSSHVGRLANLAYGLRPTVIRNGVAMPRQNMHKNRRQGPVRVVWTGRMQRQKNLAAGLRGLATIAHLSWIFDIVGDGPERQAIEEACDRYGLRSHIRFHGWLDSKAVDDIMQSADVLFLPSLNEGLSLTSVEALRAGLAFVVSDIPGMDDVVLQGENGFSCDLGMLDSFGSALARLIENRPLLESMQAASRARAPLFEASVMVDSYERELMAIRRVAGQ